MLDEASDRKSILSVFYNSPLLLITGAVLYLLFISGEVCSVGDKDVINQATCIKG